MCGRNTRSCYFNNLAASPQCVSAASQASATLWDCSEAEDNKRSGGGAALDDKGNEQPSRMNKSPGRDGPGLVRGFVWESKCPAGPPEPHQVELNPFGGFAFCRPGVEVPRTCKAFLEIFRVPGLMPPGAFSSLHICCYRRQPWLCIGPSRCSFPVQKCPQMDVARLKLFSCSHKVVRAQPFVVQPQRQRVIMRMVPASSKIGGRILPGRW